MDGDLIQQKIYSGLAKASQRLGRSHLHYRPALALNPIGEASLVGTVLATFTPGGGWYAFSNSSGPDNRKFHALLDGSLVNVGDYLVHAEGTFFIAEKLHIAPILAYRCNATVSLRRPGQPASPGLNSYGGDIVSQETVLASGWPVARLLGGKGPSGELPSDPTTPGVMFSLPAIPGVQIEPGDVFMDEWGQRFHVRGAVFSTIWSVIAGQVIA